MITPPTVSDLEIMLAEETRRRVAAELTVRNLQVLYNEVYAQYRELVSVFLEITDSVASPATQLGDILANFRDEETDGNGSLGDDGP